MSNVQVNWARKLYLLDLKLESVIYTIEYLIMKTMSLWFSYSLFVFFFQFPAGMAAQSSCEEAYEHLKQTDGEILQSTLSEVKTEEKKLRQEHGDEVRRSMCLLVLAHEAFDRFRSDRSLVFLDSIGNILKEGKPNHVRYLADMSNLRGYIYDQRAYQSLAEQQYRNAIRLYENESLYLEVIANKTSLIKLLTEKGEFNEAIELGEALSEELQDEPEVGRIPKLKATLANNLAFAYTLQAISARADLRTSYMKQVGNKGLQIFRRNLGLAYRTETENVGLALLNLASTALLVGEHDTVNHYLKVYFDSFGQTYPWHPYTAMMLSIRAMEEANAGDFEAAFRDAVNPFHLFGISIDPDSLATSDLQISPSEVSSKAPFLLTILQNKGYVLLRHYQKYGQVEYLEKALKAYAQAERILHQLQNELFDDAVLIAYRHRFLTVYPNAARTAALLYMNTPVADVEKRDKYWRLAFEYSEQAQGFALRQSVRESFEAMCIDASPSTPNCREKVLRDALFLLRKPGKEDELLQKLEQYRQFLESLKNSSNPEDRQYYQQRFSYELTTPEKIQQSLLPDSKSVFIEYVWTSPRPFALWATQQHKGLVFLDIDTTSGDAFWAKVGRFQNDWLRDEGDQDSKLGLELYRLLLEKVLNDIPIDIRQNLDRLIITPDNVLRTLPFDALVMNNKKDKTGLLSYVLLKYTVGYQHSATLWALQAEQSLNKPVEHLRIGSFINTNPSSGCGNGSQPLDSLGKLSAEIPTISKGRADTFPQATVGVFLNSVQNFDLLHFCMHGCLERNPEQSYLSFYGDSDGKLSVARIYTIKTPARLAVFASCETARQGGEHQTGLKGEGIIGLNRAFNFAGCPNTVATLNKVKDRPSADILRYFYSELLEKGEPVDVALAKAKKTYLSDKKVIHHPHYWANFICTGPPATFK